jgi:transcriptional regulator with XRE-family HTH domain
MFFRPEESNMEKTVFTPHYRVFLRHLRQAREAAGLTQVEVAAQLGRPQSFISKCESGQRRVDVVELATFCRLYGLPLAEFIARWEADLPCNDQS